MVKVWILALISIISLFLSVKLFSKMKLKIGDDAPTFELSDQEETLHRLSSYRSKIVALCFYPKDSTPGCTEEVCSLRDGYSQLVSAGVAVFGINYDHAASHKKFSGEHKLPFPLLIDKKKKVARAYGVGGWLFPSRTTFLIGKDGKIAHIIKRVDTRNHAAQIAEIIKNLA